MRRSNCRRSCSPKAGALTPSGWANSSPTRRSAKRIPTARGCGLSSSTAAPCLKCHATGDPQHDRIATAPNFLLARERLKPDWAERWILDPQAISPGTAMPSGLFKRENNHWVFAGPTPPSFQGYEKDQSTLLVDYIFQLTSEEQKHVAASMGRSRASSQNPARPKQANPPSQRAGGGGSQ